MNAKTIPDFNETKTKYDAGFKNFEIQLIHEFLSKEEYLETKKIINELNVDISVVHTPLVNGVFDEISLDNLMYEDFYNMFDDTCKYSQWIAEIENKRIKVVIHNTFSKNLWDETNLIETNIGPKVKSVLDKYSRVDLVIENSTSLGACGFKTIVDLNDVSYTVKELNKFIGNRAKTLIDTCHNMMNAKTWERALAKKITIDWDDKFAKASNGIEIGLIHLNNMWVDGIDKDHGMPFDYNHKGDIEKLKQIMNAYDKYANCEISIEVRENSYSKPPYNLLKTKECLKRIGYEQIF